MAAIAAFSLASASCGKEGSVPKAPSFDHAALLRSLAADVIAPCYQATLAKAQTLAAATEALRADAGADARWGAAAAAWEATALAFARCEPLSVGPAGPAGQRVGGMGLRDRMTSFPVTSACRVDQLLVDQGYQAADFVATTAVNAIGLDALEALLLRQDQATTCPPQALPQASWQALEAGTRRQRRADYADVVADALVATAAALVDAWASDDAGFRKDFTAAGVAGSAFATSQRAVDDVVAALLFVDLVVKDTKLGEPLGAMGNCATDVCPERVEARWSGASAGLIRANLEGLRAAIDGGGGADAFGFGHALHARGAGDERDAMLAAIATAVAACDGLGAPLQVVLVTDKPKADALLAAVDVVAKRLRGPFLTALLLQVPLEAAADND